MKRGTDHSWTLVRYKFDIAIYALCGCGYHYICSKTEGGGLKQVVDENKLFPYCPVCGARKKNYSTEVVQKECTPWASVVLNDEV